MADHKYRSILVVASYAESLLNFRGALLEALLRQGFSVHVAAPNLPINSDERLRLEAKGMIVHEYFLQRTGLNVLADLRTLISLVKLIRSIRPMYFLAYTIKPVIYGLVAAAMSGVRYRFALITGLGYSFAETGEGGLGRLLRFLVCQMYGISLRRATSIFFQNPDDEKLFREREIVASDSHTCVLNGSGIDLDRFRFVAPCASEDFSFLLIARLLGAKGIREYVNAARSVLRSYPYARFYIVGWYDEGPDAIHVDEVERWVSEGVVQFLGRLDDVKPALESCSVYVLPSYREGTPRTVLEAMAIGRAIITTNTPGCRETVVDGENGYLVIPRDSQSLAEAMLKCLANPDCVAEMGVKSRGFVERKYNVHHVNDVMLRGMGIL